MIAVIAITLSIALLAFIAFYPDLYTVGLTFFWAGHLLIISTIFSEWNVGARVHRLLWGIKPGQGGLRLSFDKEATRKIFSDLPGAEVVRYLVFSFVKCDQLVNAAGVLCKDSTGEVGILWVAKDSLKSGDNVLDLNKLVSLLSKESVVAVQLRFWDHRAWVDSRGPISPARIVTPTFKLVRYQLDLKDFILTLKEGKSDNTKKFNHG